MREQKRRREEARREGGSNGKKKQQHGVGQEAKHVSLACQRCGRRAPKEKNLDLLLYFFFTSPRRGVFRLAFLFLSLSSFALLFYIVNSCPKGERESGSAAGLEKKG